MIENTESGVTRTERLLHALCQRTFLRIWSYANPFNSDGKEFCDVVAIFGSHVFIFFDRESRKLEGEIADLSVSWKRWRKETIDKQIKTANGAERYLKRGGRLYTNIKRDAQIPISLPENAIIHKIIVAHGASEACKKHSPMNVAGSLGIVYSGRLRGTDEPFIVELLSVDRIHVLDSFNLEIILTELDTFYDFSSFIVEKERAMLALDYFSYCGEEDLLAHYLGNYNEAENKYSIGAKSDENFTGLHIGEGEWLDFSNSGAYHRRRLANRQSYLWDTIIQRTCDFYLKGETGGNADIFRGDSAILEMAREPRFSRRALSANMIAKAKDFPTESRAEGYMRHMSVMPSFYSDKMYVFLQVQVHKELDYDIQYRPVRQRMLKIACGVTKNRFPHLKSVIGIAVEPPRLSKGVSEDLLLLNCAEWTEEQKEFYDKENLITRFFATENLKRVFRKSQDFPSARSGSDKTYKVGRNETCPCGSGKKFKKCCINLGKA